MSLRWYLGLATALAGCTDDPEPITTNPPPISGGTLLVTADGVRAVAADPDRDRVWIVDLAARRVQYEIVLAAGDEPGRVAEDAHGRVHVALRRGGALVTVDPTSGVMEARTPVCAAPRGVAYDPGEDVLHVACLGGDLVTLNAIDRSVLRRVRLDRDLRDVVVRDGRLMVSRFRSAELLDVTATGALAGRFRLPQFTAESFHAFDPAVAWRTAALPDGALLVVHQRAMIDPVPLPPPDTGEDSGGSTYGTSGGSPVDPGIVHGAVSIVRPPGGRTNDPEPPPGPLVPMATLPVDIAVSPDGIEAAMVAAGSGTVMVLDVASIEATNVLEPRVRSAAHGQPVAVAYDPSGAVWVQTRRPSTVHVLGGPAVPLGTEPELDGTDGAHDLFHLTVGSFGSMACASCHPEGGDDGRVWGFVPFDGGATMLRRTQTLRGGLTEGPLHWDGTLGDMSALVREVMVARMGGSDPGDARVQALGEWLRAAPRFPLEPAADPAAAERGRAIFARADVGCATCHGGDKLTNDRTVDVGTGGALQVPTLVGISHRAPFMHDGCAPTLLDRFGPCGGGDAHGRTSHLSPAEHADLVAYLETL
jgi:DNA-binding beta-propeller fold protein YncE